MNKEEIIKSYGEEVYRNFLTILAARSREYYRKHPEKAKKNNNKKFRKGGKHYEKNREYNRTGIRGGRNRIRVKHGTIFRDYKKIIAPESEIHHEWIPNTVAYKGIALVESKPHKYGVINPIVILEGEITLLNRV